jgi:hypothetical protein
MVDSSRLVEAHEPPPGELGELACHVVLVVAARCERHRSAGDARGTADMTSAWSADVKYVVAVMPTPTTSAPSTVHTWQLRGAYSQRDV